MFKKYIILVKSGLVLMGLTLFLSFHSAYASVIINEIQVLPTGNKFFELRNTSDSAVDLTGWYIKKKTATGTESSLLVAARLEGKSIPASGYFLIANETGYTGSGTIDAGWPPSNTGVASNNTLILYDNNDSEIDKVGWGSTIDCSNPCMDNPPSEQSIQKTTSGWIIATPTPGQANQSSASSDDNSDDEEDEEDNSTTSNSSSSTSSTKKTPTETKNQTTTTAPKIKAQISVKSPAYVGIPHLFQGVALESSGDRASGGKYFWNFGDGDFRETKAINTDRFTHTYFYPGEYTVLFEYYPNFFADVPDSTHTVVLKVVAPEVFISSVGNEKDFFVELSNTSLYEADVSGWILSGVGKSFTIPRNTTLGSKQKMIISPKLTHFSIADKTSLRLATAQGDVVSDYTASNTKAVALAPKILPRNTSESKFENKSSDPFMNETSDAITDASLTVQATAIESGVLDENPSNLRTILVSFFSTIFIGAGAGAVYFIRRRNNPSRLGSDFKILGE